jgi:hypothetical protein
MRLSLGGGIHACTELDPARLSDIGREDASQHLNTAGLLGLRREDPSDRLNAPRLLGFRREDTSDLWALLLIDVGRLEAVRLLSLGGEHASDDREAVGLLSERREHPGHDGETMGLGGGRREHAGHERRLTLDMGDGVAGERGVGDHGHQEEAEQTAKHRGQREQRKREGATDTTGGRREVR